MYKRVFEFALLSVWAIFAMLVVTCEPLGGDIDRIQGNIDYAVAFNTNGGSVVAKQEVKFGNKIARPADPVKTGYIFEGWFKDEAFENLWDFGNDTVNADITLYAKWSAVYTVSFNSNEGAGTIPAAQTVRAGSGITLPGGEGLSMEGHLFRGWNTAPDGTGTSYNGGTPYTPESSIILYARWSPYTVYTVSFDKNNTDSGSTEADPPAAVIREPATRIDILPLPPARTGYTFSGWNTQADGAGTDFTIETNVQDDITVYAQWAPVSYTVTFNKNNADPGSTEADPQTKAVLYPATTIDSLPAPPALAGYNFNGWNTQADGSGTAFTASTALTGNITVYAQWTLVTYIVTFDKNNTDTGSTDANPQTKAVTHPATTIDSLPAPPVRAGHTFNGWNTHSNGLGASFTALTNVTEDITVYAQWTTVTYTVTFNKNNTDAGSTEADPQTKAVLYPATTIDSLPTQPTRSHYTFNGWNTQADGSGTAFTASTVVTGNITVYAQWTPITYTVTFNKNNTDAGGTEAYPQARTVTYPAVRIDSLPAPPMRTGHDFNGWNTQANGSGTAFTTATNVTGDITVYAQWTAFTYTVTFNKNNIDTGSTEADPQIKAVIFPAVIIDSLPVQPERAHYTFNGWNTQANGSGTAFTTSTVVTENITVYAQWTPVTYTVTFNKNNTDTGSTNADPQTKTVTRPATTVDSLPMAPARTGYTFDGWNTQANGSGTAFTASTVVTENITVYAQWTPVTYTVTFNKNNTDAGSTEANPQTKTVIYPATTIDSLPAVPTWAGYNFNGWNTQANGSGLAFTTATSVTEDITVYAQWTISVSHNRFEYYWVDAHGSLVTTSGGAATVGPGGTLTITAQGTGYDVWQWHFNGVNTGHSGNTYNFSSTTFGKHTVGLFVEKDGKFYNTNITITVSSIIETVWIPAGTFTMGSPATEPNRSSDETQRQVTLTSGFYMGIYQVTQEQYQAVMGTNPSSFSSNPASGEVQGKRPVENVSWYNAIVFCNRLSMMEGLSPAYRISGSTNPDDWGSAPTSSNAAWNSVQIVAGSNGYRLPTEAQWEYACRAGTTTAYNTGASISDATGWYSSNSGSRTHEVGKLPSNAWGLYDMHGNVREWCWDWYGSYASGAQTDPLGASSGSYRVRRGGGWLNSAGGVRSAYRNYDNPFYRNGDGGFRLLRP